MTEAPPLRPIPPDRALPGLAELLPSHGVPKEVVEAVQALTGGAADGSAARTDYVRWRPGRSCTVLWRFAQPSLRVTVSLFASGSADAAEARQLAAVVDPGQTGHRYLPDREILVQLFPVDDSLPGLPFAADAGRVGEALGVELGAAVPIAYKTRRRCVLSYLGSDGRPLFYGKVFRDERGASMPAQLAALRAQLSDVGHPWTFPEAVAYLPAPRLLLLEAVEGAVEVRSLIRAGQDGGSAAGSAALNAMARAAEGLAAFRGAMVAGLPLETPETVLHPIWRGMRQLQPVLPELADAVAARLDALERDAFELPPEPVGLTHGAFRYGQLLVRGEELVVLDIDGLCLAGIAADPGCFLAGLDRTASRNPRLRPVLAACEEAFIDALQRTAPVHPGWLAWHRAAAGVQTALRSAFSLDANWPERAAWLLRAEIAPAPTATPV